MLTALPLPNQVEGSLAPLAPLVAKENAGGGGQPFSPSPPQHYALLCENPYYDLSSETAGESFGETTGSLTLTEKRGM